MFGKCFEKRQIVPLKPFDSAVFGNAEAAANAEADLMKSRLLFKAAPL
jgi:hypothetical protein